MKTRTPVHVLQFSLKARVILLENDPLEPNSMRGQTVRCKKEPFSSSFLSSASYSFCFSLSAAFLSPFPTSLEHRYLSPSRHRIPTSPWVRTQTPLQPILRHLNKRMHRLKRPENHKNNASTCFRFGLPFWTQGVWKAMALFGANVCHSLRSST